MRKHQLAPVVFAGGLVILLSLAGAKSFGQERPLPPPPPSAPPSLAGRWELNVQSSDPISTGAHEPGEEGGGRRGGGGGGGRGGGSGGRGGMGGGGMGGRGGGESGGGKERESGSVQEEMRRIMEAQRVLVIVQHETTLSVTDDGGRVVTLKPDGVKVKEEQAGETIERTTKWDGRSLVTQIKLSNGVHVTQTYTKVNEGLELLIDTKVEGGRFPKGTAFRRVYEQAFQ